MKNGYEIRWTDYALEELEQTIHYLENHFSEKEIKKLARKIESITEIISQNPFAFPKSDKQPIYKVVILKYNSMYYRISENEVQIVSFFSNRQNPNKRKI